MSSSELKIVKRNGVTVPFSIEKIKNAVRKAFLSVGTFATEEDLTNILARVNISNGMSVEEIQNQVEVALMAGSTLLWPRVTCSIASTIPRTARRWRS